MKAVHIVWEDSTGRGGWISRPDAAQSVVPMTCETIGFVVKADKRQILLAHSIDEQTGEDKHVHNLISIPRFAIKKVRRLKL